MKRALLASLALLAIGASAARAQLVNYPVDAVPVGGDPATLLSVDWGRGLNEASGKLNAFGLAVGRTGIGGRGTAVLAANMIDDDPDSEYSFAGIGAVGVSRPESPTQISIQAGIGYFSPADDVTAWSIPIGVAVAQIVPGESAEFAVWGMPRVHLSRITDQDMEADFGASGGVAVTMPNGLGLHAAIDLLVTDPDNVVGFGLGLHYMIP